MAQVKKSNEGVSQFQKYRVFYHVRKENETRVECMNEVIYWEHHPMIQEVGQLLMKKHGTGCHIGIVAWFESQEDCC